MAVLLGKFVGLARKSGYSMVVLMQKFTAQLTDALQGIKPLKAMNCERFLIPLFEKTNSELDRTIRLQVFAKYGLSLLREPIVVSVLAFGMYFLLTYQKVHFAELLTMVVLFHRSVAYIGVVQQAFQQVRASEFYYWSINKLTESAINDEEIFIENGKAEFTQSIEFNDVNFSYNQHDVLKKVTFELPASGLCALIGPSGAGKTTLSDILCGLNAIDSGKITIDGDAFDKIDVKLWRQRIGYVPQELFLFHDSIAKNVTLGDSSISPERVIQALNDAGALGFVQNLEHGIDTVIGERGLKLSGGQRQRVAIARALVRNPRLLILDEATTALDPDTELEIINTIKKLSNNISVLAISHQESIVNAANRVFFLENGQLKRIK